MAVRQWINRSVLLRVASELSKIDSTDPDTPLRRMQGDAPRFRNVLRGVPQAWEINPVYLCWLPFRSARRAARGEVIPKRR